MTHLRHHLLLTSASRLGSGWCVFGDSATGLAVRVIADLAKVSLNTGLGLDNPDKLPLGFRPG